MTRASARVRVFLTPAALAAGAAGIIRRRASAAVAARGRFTLALSGGETPKALYRALAGAGGQALPYDRLEVFWVDERAVAPDHRDSNYRLAWESWLSRMPVSTRLVHRMRGEARPLMGEARRYERRLRRRLGKTPRIDLVLLGIGPDGHTASLFPRAPALRSTRLVEAAVSPTAPPHRITMTLHAIRSARAVLVLAAGRGKAAPVAAALLARPSEMVPASLLRGRNVAWLLDRAAAARLPRNLRLSASKLT